MSHVKPTRTQGGSQLRALRTASGKTQLDVELAASLGIGYLQRLELGKVQRPDYETLERILAALGARYSEQSEILHAFGYTAAPTLPTDEEREQAVNFFRAETQQASVPVYLLDCTHRLLAWNTFVEALFETVRGMSAPALMPRLIFDPACGIAESVLNAHLFFPVQVRILHFEKLRCGNEAWYTGFIDEMRHYRLFDDCWRKTEETLQTPALVRPVAPLMLQLAQGVAQFRLISETFVGDPRFRLIYCLPADSATLQMTLSWQS